jgi:hypothetical protein
MTSLWRWTLALGLYLSALGTGGCNVIGWAAQPFAGEKAPPISVTAEYHGLDGRSVAVVVDADHSTLYQYPTALLEVCTAVTNLIAANVPDVQTVEPRQIVDFQQRNYYWSTMQPAELAHRLGVERLVLITLTEYRTHEPGNVNLYRGVITGSLEVYETESASPNRAAYASVVTAHFPNTNIGVPNADELTIRKGTLDLFALRAAGRFFDHEEPRE